MADPDPPLDLSRGPGSRASTLRKQLPMLISTCRFLHSPRRILCSGEFPEASSSLCEQPLLGGAHLAQQYLDPGYKGFLWHWSQKSPWPLCLSPTAAAVHPRFIPSSPRQVFGIVLSRPVRPPRPAPRSEIIYLHKADRLWGH